MLDDVSKNYCIKRTAHLGLYGGALYISHNHMLADVLCDFSGLGIYLDPNHAAAACYQMPAKKTR